MTPSPISSLSRHRVVIAALLVLFLATGVGLHYYRGKHASVQPAIAPVPVATTHVVRKPMSVWLRSIGTVQALNTISVKSRVDGELTGVYFQEGQMVKAGDLLAQIDPRPYRAALNQASAQVQKDQAERANAELDLARYAKLSQLHLVAQQELDTQAAQAKSLLASVRADMGALDSARLQLDFTRIVAPITGRVGQRLVDQGSQVHSSDTTGLVTITQLEPITVAFSIPQDALGEVASAQHSRPLVVEAAERNGGKVLATGTLSFIDSQIDATTGQILLKAQYTNADHALWPGAFVAVRLLLRTDPRALVVPSRAVQHDQTGAFVYVVNAQGKAEPRQVGTAQSEDGLTAITSGLAEGERVVTDGQVNLSAGAPISEDPAQATKP